MRYSTDTPRKRTKLLAELKANIFRVSSRHGIRNVIIDDPGKRIHHRSPHPPFAYEFHPTRDSTWQPSESTNIKPLRLPFNRLAHPEFLRPPVKTQRAAYLSSHVTTLNLLRGESRDTVG